MQRVEYHTEVDQVQGMRITATGRPPWLTKEVFSEATTLNQAQTEKQKLGKELRRWNLMQKHSMFKSLKAEKRLIYMRNERGQGESIIVARTIGSGVVHRI